MLLSSSYDTSSIDSDEVITLELHTAHDSQFLQVKSAQARLESDIRSILLTSVGRKRPPIARFQWRH